MTPDTTAIGALATAVVALAGSVAAITKLVRDMGKMSKQLRQMQSQSQPQPLCGTDTNPGTGEGCAPLRVLEAAQTDMRADVAEVKRDVKQILWHMVNGTGSQRGGG